MDSPQPRALTLHSGIQFLPFPHTPFPSSARLWKVNCAESGGLCCPSQQQNRVANPIQLNNP